MIASNIFKWIGSLFTDILFIPFRWLRLEVATADLGWWISNAVNWGFLVVLLVLFAYWMKESKRFLDEGTEDRA
ncbi:MULTISPECIES: DUF6341 family protein [Polaribacter]|jgi:hypothetical protein|uniref:Uracil phosphoribosyltransferase n=1 Tax=Polaribacter dokdonensis DSW-5 TaxID=1300348 RepID=A0A0N0UNF9_9FLAO|nr:MULTISPECIES: hypothetical protein [Polaribacter]KOY51524.1 hypothetical protein I602_1084 [Polaribacter dokdonensis DSW-5]SEE09530.1 hypothetical protein SAMN05444353_0692 [Polaribacter dokdonensis DSW-5]